MKNMHLTWKQRLELSRLCSLRNDLAASLERTNHRLAELLDKFRKANAEAFDAKTKTNE